MSPSDLDGPPDIAVLAVESQARHQGLTQVIKPVEPGDVKARSLSSERMHLMPGPTIAAISAQQLRNLPDNAGVGDQEPSPAATFMGTAPPELCSLVGMETGRARVEWKAPGAAGRELYVWYVFAGADTWRKVNGSARPSEAPAADRRARRRAELYPHAVGNR